MPNIEIHGLGQKKTQVEMREEIFEAFSNKSYVDEMIVEIYPTDPQDKNKKSQSYFRVVNDCQEHTGEIIEILQAKFGMDVEHLRLEKFYPKPDCGCEGSCPVCRTGEVKDHKCNRCGAEFCSKCHGITNHVESQNVLPCKCGSD